MQLNSCAKGTNGNNPESSEAKFRVNKKCQVNESANGAIGISLNHKRHLNPLWSFSRPSRLSGKKNKLNINPLPSFVTHDLTFMDFQIINSQIQWTIIK